MTGDLKLHKGEWLKLLLTLKLAGITPSPRVKQSMRFSIDWSRRVFNKKFFTMSGSPFMRNARALGTKSRTKTCTYIHINTHMSPWRDGRSDRCIKRSIKSWCLSRSVRVLGLFNKNCQKMAMRAWKTDCLQGDKRKRKKVLLPLFLEAGLQRSSFLEQSMILRYATEMHKTTIFTTNPLKLTWL